MKLSALKLLFREIALLNAEAAVPSGFRAHATTALLRKGLSFVNWSVLEHSDHHVVMHYVSPHLADGFPGELSVSLEYRLLRPVFSGVSTPEGVSEAEKEKKTVVDGLELQLRYTASLSGPADSWCPVNLTNHSYWNLCGHLAGKRSLASHRLCLRANSFLESDPITILPTGRVASVVEELGVDANGKGLMDFRFPNGRRLEAGLDSIGFCQHTGYDHFFLFNQ
ncbi:unnamed protein product [Protopolystoma xenopodis]|uniref:Galactose mutarotase n=1 Tax=Protopolystoma xenopodis TaxID=117903 RepID=A0A3S5FDB3_9PLAT|nr:unnamed protein product [Protopolystoma xenopodis]